MMDYFYRFTSNLSNPNLFYFILSSAFTLIFFTWLFQVLRRRFISSRENSVTVTSILGVIIQRTTFPLFLTAALGVGSFFIQVSPDLQVLLRRIIAFLLAIQGGLWAEGLLSLLLNSYISGTEDLSRRSAFHLLRFIGTATIWLIVTLLLLENFGFDVTTLVAGLGIGGIALALAVQNVLGDLLASLSLVMDKPFVVGDSISTGQTTGKVEEIGIKTTKIRSLTGELVIIPNSDLLKGELRNFKQMQERRVVYVFGVTYDTPIEKLESIPQWLKEIIESQPLARFDRAHFKAHGDFSLLFEVVYFIQSPDYSVYMDTQQQINLGLSRKFEEVKVQFAFPTQTLEITKLPRA